MITDSIQTASRETLLHRFFSPIRKVPPDVLRKMLDIDRTKGACVVGVLSRAEGDQIICGVRYVRLDSPDRAEIALTVHDKFQRCGLGSLLLQMILRMARADGIRWVEAYIMGSNSGMLGLLRRQVHHSMEWKRNGEVYQVIIDLHSPLLNVER